MSAMILQVSGLEKSFGGARAVDGVSFAVRAGECVGLLGPNGAGKTTTISMITGLLTADRGEVLIEGRQMTKDTDTLKSKIGLVPQDLALFEELSAQDNLQLFGALYGLPADTLAPAMKSALELVGLSERARDRVRHFSGGMKRRLNLAGALLHDPDLLLLDEPTVGVDPQSRNAIFDNIEALRARGKTILYTTHYMEEVERLCDRVIIIDAGKVVADDTLAHLRQSGGSQRLKIELTSAPTETVEPLWLDELRRVPGVRCAVLDGPRLTLDVGEISENAPAVFEFLRGRGQKMVYFSSDRPNLESVFLSLTGKKLRDS